MIAKHLLKIGIIIFPKRNYIIYFSKDFLSFKEK